MLDDDIEIEIRCPVHPVRLMLKLAHPRVIEGANLLEIPCRDCRKDKRDAGERVKLVLHRFNVLGQCVETEVVPAES